MEKFELRRRGGGNREKMRKSKRENSRKEVRS
jgi:hypothetical protein